MPFCYLRLGGREGGGGGKGGREGGGGLGPKTSCTDSGPTRFSLLQIALSRDGPFGLGGGGGVRGGGNPPSSCGVRPFPYLPGGPLLTAGPSAPQARTSADHGTNGRSVSGSAPDCRARDALEGKGPQRRPQRRLDRRLEAVAKAVGGGYCRLQMPLRPALGVRGTVAGRRLGALGKGGGVPPPPPMHLAPRPPPSLGRQTAGCSTHRLPQARRHAVRAPPASEGPREEAPGGPYDEKGNTTNFTTKTDPTGRKYIPKLTQNSHDLCHAPRCRTNASTKMSRVNSMNATKHQR